MNHVYRLKRSGRTQQLQPVPETARAAGKGSRTGKTLAQTVTATLASVALGGMASLAHAQQAPPAMTPPAANQLPQGGVVTRGSAHINTSTTAAGNALMSVNQSSNRAVIDWASFNVGSQAKVQFNQPSSSAVTLNNILGNNASQIFGQISANGQVFLSNPNGVYFSPTAQVNVGGLVATTGKANADEFMAGKISFNRAGSTGSVVNEGQLTSAAGGYIALLAPEVRNQGVVVAQAGTVALASGEAITLSFNNTGTGLAGITTTPQAIAALVENRSVVLAEGGQIILSAHALATLQGSVVKNSGQLSATSLQDKGGKIVLMADSIELTGTSRIEANGPMGGGTVLVGGDWQGSGDTRQAVQVTMASGASIEANATGQGDGGKVVLWSDVHNASGVTQVDGRIEAKAAGTGSGGQVETSGFALNVGEQVSVNTQAAGHGAAGQWLLDPADIDINSTGPEAGSTNSSGTLTPNSGVASSIIKPETIQSALASGDVTITTTNNGTSGSGTGNITVTSDVVWSSVNKLTLRAAGGVSGAGNITINNVSGKLTIDQSGTSTYSGIIGGSGGFAKLGTGTLTLSGNNSYGGVTTVSGGGVLKVGSPTAIGISIITVSSGSALDLNGQVLTTNNGLTLSGTGIGNAGALMNSGNTSATFNGVISLGSTSSIVAEGAPIVLSTTGYLGLSTYGLTLAGAAGGSLFRISGTGTLTKSGSGTWTLTNVSTYTGSTSINGGTLQFEGIGALHPSSAINIDASATLAFKRTTTTVNNTITGSGAIANLNPGTTLTLSTAAALTGGTYVSSVNQVPTTPTFGKIILGESPNLTGTVFSVITSGFRSSFSSQNAISWTGAATGTPTLELNGTTVNSGDSMLGASLVLNPTNLSVGAGALWFLTNNGNTTYFSTVTDATGATLVGNATASVYQGASVTKSGLISGSGSLTVTGGGTITLSGANTYSGGTTISMGVVKAGRTNALGTGAVTVTNGAALDLNGQTMTSIGMLTLNGTGVSNGGALMNSGGAATYAGLVVLGAASSIVGGSGSIALTNTGTTTGATYDLTLGGAAGGSFASAIGTTTGRVTKEGVGTWVLSGSNTYSGGTFINGGTLQISSDANLGAVPGTAATNITINGGTLAVAGQPNGFYLDAKRQISIGSSGGTIANNGSYELDVRGDIASTGAVTVTGGDITFGNIAVSNASPILVKSTGNIAQSASSTVSTAGGTITYWADSDGSGDGKIVVSNGVSGSLTHINANGGNIVLGGGSGASAAAGVARGLYGAYVGNYASVQAGTGSVTIQGESNANGGTGVYVGSSSTVSGANVTLTGTGYANSSAGSNGVRLLGSAAASNLLTITGTGGGTASTSTSTAGNYGVWFYGGVAEATGSGSVVINATGGGYQPGAANHGLYMQAYPAATSIRSVTGSVLVNATAGTSSTAGASLGYSMPTNTGSVTLGDSTQTGSLTLRSDSWYFGPTSILGSQSVTLEPLTGSTSFASTGLNLTYVTLSPTITALTLGKAGNTARVAVGPEGPGVTFPVTSYSVAGPISIYGDIYLGTPLATTGTGANGVVTLSGNVTEVQNGKLTAPSLLLLGTGASNVAMSNQYAPKANLIGTLAGSGLGTVSIDNGSFGTVTGAGALTVGTVGGVSGLSATGPVLLNTYRDNLTLVNDVVTTNTGTSAITLSAGRFMAVGDTTHGNVVLNGGTITTGTGGRALVYTGTVAGSTGIGSLVGSGSGNFRYGSTALATFSTTNYTTALGSSGYYAIYRERPTVTWTSSTGQTVAYGVTPISPATDALSGFVNGDTIDTTGALRLASDNSLASVNASGLYNVGSYVYSRTEGAKALGYLVNNPALTIDRAVVTVTANDATKTYDGLGYSGGNGASYSGFVGADTAGNSLRGTLTYSGTSQGAVNADTYVITPGGLRLASYAAFNYTLSYAPGTLTVGKAPLTVRINDDARFLTEADAAAYAGASYAGFVARQTPSVLGGALTISRTGGDTLAGTYNGVLSGSGLTSANYSFNYVPGSYTIVPADQLLVKMSNIAATYASEPVYTVASAKYFRSSTNSLVDLTGLVQITGNAFSLNDGAGGTTAFTLGAASPSLSLGGQLNVGAYQLGSSGIVTNANYSNTMTLTGALQVNPKAVTAAVTSSVSKAYDGTLGLNGLTLGVTGAVTGDALGANGAGAYDTQDVGSGLVYSVKNIALTGADARNYVLTDSGTQAASNTLTGNTGVISAVPLTVTASNASKTYDGVAYSGGNGLTFSGFVNNETEVDLSGALSYGGTSQSATNAGTYSIIPSGYSSTNYSIGYVNGALTIAPVNVSAVVGALQGSVSKVYDGTQVATLNSGHYALSGWVGQDGATVTRTLGTYDTASAGTYKTVTVNLTNADYALNPGTILSNYILPTTLSGPVGLITAKPVTVTSTARTATYNGVNTYGSLASGASFSTSDLVGADVVSSVTQTASGTGVTSSGVAQAGSFSVTPSHAVMGVGNANNYSFSYVDSVYTVNPVVVTVRSMNGALQGTVNKVYDGTNAATLSSANYVLTGWVGSDGATVTRTLGSYDTVNVGTGKTVTVMLSHSDFLASGSTQLSNYVLPNMVSGAVGSITKATLTPNITASSKVYDTTTDATGSVSLAGVFSADAASASAVAASYSFDNANVGVGKTVTAIGITLGAGIAGNYQLSSTQASGLANITPAPVMVTAINSAKFVTQGDQPGYGGYAVTGLLGGQLPADAGISAGVTVSRSNSATHEPGEYSGVLVPVGNATIGNYAVSYVPGTYTIVPARQLLVQATNGNTTYGTAGSPVLASVSYLDDNSNTITDLTLSSQAVVGGNTVYTYADGASGTVSFSAAPAGTSLSAGGFVNVGSYGLAASNVSKTTSNLTTNTVTMTGNFTVQPLAVNVAATPGVTTYNSAAQTQATTSGLLSGDAVSIAGAVSQRNAGSYTSELSVSGNDVANYRVTYANSNYTINPAVLNATFTAANKVYDGNTTASLLSTDNRLGSDVLTVSATGRFADKNVGTAKPVTVSAIALTGADAANYTVNSTASTTAAITRLAQVTWVGGTTGSWFDPANWAGGAVPDMANVANVTIPAGVTVSFDNVAVSPAQAGPVNVDSLGTAGSLALSAGSLNVGMGGVTLNALTQTGGALATTGAVVLGSLSQSAGSLSAGSLSTTTAYSQSGTGTIAVTGDVAIAATAAPVVLGNLSTGGTLSVSSTGGSITQTAGTVLTLTGPATFTASQGGAAADVTLDNAGNALNGPVTATGADVKLRTTGALTASVTATGNATLTSSGSTTLGATTVGGDLQVTTANADVTQTGPVVVGGTTTLNAGTGAVQLTDAGNRFAGAVSVTAASQSMTGAPDVAAQMNQAPQVVTPRTLQASLPYQVTLIQLPQGDARGQVHIEIQNAIGDVQMELPSVLKKWMAAAGSEVALENGSAAVLDGVDLADNGATLNVRASVDRSIPLEFVIRAGREQVAVRIVWKP